MDKSRWLRVVCIDAAALLLLLAAHDLITSYSTLPALLGSDIVEGYLPGAQRFLDTGSPYTSAQLAGPWILDYHSFVHPPAALALFVPFLFLPLALWWAIPLGITVYAVWRLRPAPWAWVIMAACLWWPRSTGSLLVGNTDIWTMAAVAAGAIWGWPFVVLAIKPTFAPLALIGVRRRSTWIASAVILALMVITLPLWLQWWTAIGNAGLGAGYSVLNLPLVLLPVVAWLGRRPPSQSTPMDPTGSPAFARTSANDVASLVGPTGAADPLQVRDVQTPDPAERPSVTDRSRDLS